MAIKKDFNCHKFPLVAVWQALASAALQVKPEHACVRVCVSVCPNKPINQLERALGSKVECALGQIPS